MFENEDLLDAWTKQPIHDGLVDALDKYRDRNYFEAVRVYDVEVDPATLEWTKYTIK